MFAVHREGCSLRPLTPVTFGSSQQGVRSSWDNSQPRAGRTSRMVLSADLRGPGRAEGASCRLRCTKSKGVPNTVAQRLFWLLCGTNTKLTAPLLPLSPHIHTHTCANRIVEKACALPWPVILHPHRPVIMPPGTCDLLCISGNLQEERAPPSCPGIRRITQIKNSSSHICQRDSGSQSADEIS